MDNSKNYELNDEMLDNVSGGNGEGKKRFDGFLNSIWYSDCKSCQKCCTICPKNIIIWNTDAPGYFEYSEANCDGCGKCFDICPHNLIKFTK